MAARANRSREPASTLLNRTFAGTTLDNAIVNVLASEYVLRRVRRAANSLSQEMSVYDRSASRSRPDPARLRDQRGGRRSSARIRGRCGSTRTRACSARHGRQPTSASTARTTSGGSTWIRHLTRDRGVNLAGIRILFELEERLGARILEALYAEGHRNGSSRAAPSQPNAETDVTDRRRRRRRRPPQTPNHRQENLMAKRPSTPVDEQPTTRR